MTHAGKAIAVTGGASGIGKEAALAMARGGASIVIIDINEDAARRVAAEVQGAGGRGVVVRADLSSVAEVRASIHRAADAYGRMDAVANVAAIYPAAGVFDVTEELWERIMAVDLRGVFFACQEALKLMIAQGHGSIVNVASAAAFRARRGQVAYSAAKGGVVAMSRVLALEGARKGVRVNVVAPGPTATDTILGTFDRQQAKAFGERLVPGRWVEPREVAAAIAFLCSDAASGINGAVLAVSAGDWMP